MEFECAAMGQKVVREWEVVGVGSFSTRDRVVAGGVMRWGLLALALFCGGDAPDFGDAAGGEEEEGAVGGEGEGIKDRQFEKNAA